MVFVGEAPRQRDPLEATVFVTFFHVVSFTAGFPAVLVRNLPTAEAAAVAALPFPTGRVVAEPVAIIDAERLAQIDREITADNLAEVARING